MKRTIYKLCSAAAVALAIPLLACGGPVGEEPTAAAAGATGPRHGGTLVVGLIADIGSVNVYATLSTTPTQEAITLMFLRLMEEQPDYQEHPPTLKPQLAESWEFSPDRKILTVHLREDILWSDGVPVTAEDVRFTWQAQTHPAVIWDSAYYKDGIDDVEVVDPHTVRFHFNRVSANQLFWVNEGEIIPQHAWSQLPFEQWRENSDWFLEHLVVSGPYIVTSWTPQQEIVLARNERYYQAGLPYIDRVVIRVVPDRSSLLTQALAGDLDVVTGLALSDVQRVERAPHLKLVSHWGRGQVFVAWNTRHPFFSETAVRQALTMAIDRTAIIEAIYGEEYGRLPIAPVLTDVWALNDELEQWPYDPEEAQRILAAHGWTDSDGDGILDRDGKPFSFDLLTNVGNQQRIDATVMIQGQLRRVGIDARPRTEAFNPLMERANRHEFEAILMRWGVPTDLDLTYAYHSASIASGFNVFSYSNPEVDRLLERVQTVPDFRGFKEHLEGVQALIHRDQPMTLLWESKDLGTINRRVHYQEPNVLRWLWHLWEWWLEPAA